MEEKKFFTTKNGVRVPHNGGRAEYVLDWKQIDDWLACDCSGMEIASRLGIHHDTLYDRIVKKFKMPFSDYAASKRASGDLLLKEAQFKKAVGFTKKGDTTLLTFLGRTRLKQVEAQPEKFEPIVPNEMMLVIMDENIRLKAELAKISKPIEVANNAEQETRE